MLWYSPDFIPLSGKEAITIDRKMESNNEKTEQ